MRRAVDNAAKWFIVVSISHTVARVFIQGSPDYPLKREQAPKPTKSASFDDRMLPTSYSISRLSSLSGPVFGLRRLSRFFVEEGAWMVVASTTVTPLSGSRQANAWIQSHTMRLPAPGPTERTIAA